MKQLAALSACVALGLASCATHHSPHASHPHQHGPGCGHVAVYHAGHIDYVDEGHLHRPHAGHADEHVIAVSASNPARCTPGHGPAEHASHTHGPNCGHPAVPHGDHTDYLVADHLHHPDGNHCDDHGALAVVK